MHTAQHTNRIAVAPAANPAQLPESLEILAFAIGGEEYGIDIHKVQELRGYDAVTRIANAPDFMKGVMNLRGIIVPIIDMRIKFNLAAAQYDQFTVVIILNIDDRTMGVVVDRVSDVMTLTAAQIKPAPEMGTASDSNFVIGLAALDERMLVLLDMDKLMPSPESGWLDKISMW